LPGTLRKGFAGARHVELRVLRDSAIQVAGRAFRIVLEGGHPPLLGRQEPVVHGGADWVEVEAEVFALYPAWCSYSHEGARFLGVNLGKQHEELFDVGW